MLEFKQGFGILDVFQLLKCDTAVLLLQHGVNPNFYDIRDFFIQFGRHDTFNHPSCVKFEQLLKTFIGAGYSFSRNDRLDSSLMKKLEKCDVHIN